MNAPHRYHHGALRTALLEAAEKLLNEGGVGGLTLRAIAREAGVSHGAPAHHFADLSALLSELAASGYLRLAEALRAAGGGPSRNPVARAYLAFARANPALFSLMFRDDRLRPDYPALREARAAAGDALASTLDLPQAGATLAAVGEMAAAWSMVHGFAVLAIDGRLAPFLTRAPQGADIDDLFDAALARLDVGLRRKE